MTKSVIETCGGIAVLPGKGETDSPQGVRNLIREAILIGMIGLLGLSWTKTDDSVLRRPIAPFHSNDDTAFHAILRFGRENNIPLGLVLNHQLCSTVFVHFNIEHASVQTVLEEFARRLPSYQWRLDDGVVVFAPSDVPGATADFLALKVPSYAIPEETLQTQAFYAWMNIKTSLRPEEGTAFNILSSPKSEKWPALTLGNLTVQEVLNRLVARKAGGAWILLPFEDLNKVADHRPFWVTGYSDDGSEQLDSPCSKYLPRGRGKVVPCLGQVGERCAGRSLLRLRRIPT